MLHTTVLAPYCTHISTCVYYTSTVTESFSKNSPCYTSWFLILDWLFWLAIFFWGGNQNGSWRMMLEAIVHLKTLSKFTGMHASHSGYNIYAQSSESKTNWSGGATSCPWKSSLVWANVWISGTLKIHAIGREGSKTGSGHGVLMRDRFWCCTLVLLYGTYVSSQPCHSLVLCRGIRIFYILLGAGHKSPDLRPIYTERTPSVCASIILC